MNNLIAHISQWFSKAKPEPTQRDFTIQLGVHYEEVSEHLTSLHTEDSYTRFLINEANANLYLLADHLKTQQVLVDVLEDQIENHLDACLDQIVTAVGLSTFKGHKTSEALQEVDRSNWSKFDQEGNPILNEHGKIAKGPDYTPPNLKPYL